MILQVAPVEKNVGETICSLNFGQRVRSVELGAATRKTENAEMAELRDRLAQYEDGVSPTKPKSYTPNKPTRRKWISSPTKPKSYTPNKPTRCKWERRDGRTERQARTVRGRRLTHQTQVLHTK